MIKTITGVLLLLFTAKFATSQNMITNLDTVITGPISLAQLEQFQWFATGFISFKPDSQSVAQINKARTKGMKITVIAGSWCEDTQKHLPSFMKVLHEAKWPQDAVSIYFLDRDKKSPEGYENTYGVSLVPTFILWDNDKELGRIVEYFSIGPEADLLMLMMVK